MEMGAGVMVDALLPPILAQHGQIQVPGLHLAFAVVDNVHRLGAESHRGQTRRNRQALLGAGITNVNAPVVYLQVYSPQGGNPINQEKGFGVFKMGAQLFQRLANAGAGFGKNHGTGLGVGVGLAGFDKLLHIQRLAPFGLHLYHLSAAAGPATSFMRMPKTPLTPMITLSPGSRLFTKLASMPAEPVPLTGKVIWLLVW